MVTKNDIKSFLRNCGINNDDIVTIHCSLKAIGEIENGADGLIDGFCEYLNNGLFIVPTHTWQNVSKENPYYDVRKTLPCIGVLARIAAFRSDGVRSLHPTHSVTVFGKGAAEFVCGEENSETPTPLKGCLNSLYEKNGKILLIGVGHERNTFLHAIDERFNIPDRLNHETFEITITDYDGYLHKSPPFHTHCTFASDVCVSEYYPNYKKAFEYTGAVTYSQLGNALVYCCDARKMTDTAYKILMNSDTDLFLCHKEIPEEHYK